MSAGCGHVPPAVLCNKTMIVSNIIGGLGNQMFQYALARHLAVKNNDDFCLDVSGFEIYKLHQYCLPFLKIIEKCAAEDIVTWRRSQSDKLSLLSRLFCRRASYRLVKEREFCFQPEILTQKGNIYLHGYWQSEKYFLPIRNILMKEFVPKTNSEAATKLQAQIASTPNAVAVHVRRGDYVSNPQTNQIHGTCGPDYYLVASRLIQKRAPRPHFFVFSDDAAWARQNIALGGTTTFIEGNKNYEDLSLMSSCRHNIIANSSFSWCAAWLNDYPNKT